MIIGAAWLAVSAVRSLQGIVGPLLLVLNLVIVAYPVQARLNKWGLPRIIGAIASGLIVFAIVVTFFGALAWAMALLVQEIPGYQQQFSALYQSTLDQLARLGVSETQAMAQLQGQLNPSRVVGLAASTLSGLTGALTLLLVTVTIVFVVLIDSMSLPKRLEVAGRTHADIVAALTGFAHGVRRYWVVSSVFGAIVAVLDIIALWYLGVPLALVWGMLSFLTNYIPNIGFVIGIIPPTLMALLANDPWTALMVVVAYCVINFVIQSIIQPKFLGDAVGVTATVSLLSLLFWAWVLGPLGALLALPSTLLCKALLVDLDPRMRWFDAFIASHPESGNQLRKGRRKRSTASTPG
nr:AI-2E family transporter [Kineosphaera limosa]